MQTASNNRNWEYLEKDRVQLTDNNNVFEVRFTDTTLVMEFGEAITNENPDGIHVIFVFLRS